MGYAENKVEGYLVRECEAHGFKCYKTVFQSRRGAPDRLIMGNGYTIFVETKAPEGKLSKQQVFRIREMRNLGGNVFTAYTREQVDEIIDGIVNDTLELNPLSVGAKKQQKSKS